jgi:hypothetical protein
MKVILIRADDPMPPTSCHPCSIEKGRIIVSFPSVRHGYSSQCSTVNCEVVCPIEPRATIR